MTTNHKDQKFNVYIREGIGSAETLEKANITSAVYLEPIRDRLQKPIEGLPVLKPFQSKNNPCHPKVQSIHKGVGVKKL